MLNWSRLFDINQTLWQNNWFSCTRSTCQVHTLLPRQKILKYKWISHGINCRN